MVARKPLVQDSLFILRIFGVNTENQTVWENIRCAVILIPFYILFLQSFLNVVLNWNGVDSMYDLSMFGVICQVLAKANTVAFNRQKLQNMLGVINQFSQMNASNNEIEAIYRSVKQSYKIGLFFALFSTTILYGIAIMFRKIPITMYYPPNPYSFYELIMLYQVFLATISSGYFGSEHLFFTFSTYIFCEFKLIKKQILKLPHIFSETGHEKKLLQELSMIIDQQNLVLKFVEMLNDYYSSAILILFVSSILILSASLASVIVKSSENIESNFVPVLFISYFSMVLLVYCWTGNVIMTSSEDVLHAIFESNAWLIQDPIFQKALILVILRSQKLANVRAGGVFDLNLETFTKVVNSTFSFFSLFKATYGQTARN